MSEKDFMDCKKYRGVVLRYLFHCRGLSRGRDLQRVARTVYAMSKVGHYWSRALSKLEMKKAGFRPTTALVQAVNFADLHRTKDAFAAITRLLPLYMTDKADKGARGFLRILKHLGVKRQYINKIGHALDDKMNLSEFNQPETAKQRAMALARKMKVKDKRGLKYLQAAVQEADKELRRRTKGASQSMAIDVDDDEFEAEEELEEEVQPMPAKRRSADKDQAADAAEAANADRPLPSVQLKVDPAMDLRKYVAEDANLSHVIIDAAGATFSPEALANTLVGLQALQCSPVVIVFVEGLQDVRVWTELLHKAELQIAPVRIRSVLGFRLCF